MRQIESLRLDSPAPIHLDHSGRLVQLVQLVRLVWLLRLVRLVRLLPRRLNDVLPL